ncbi:membrane-bound lytic murein transglycosylase F [Desulfosarcina ovata subsp. sediminis]|uniref:Membrane-bound lytic murein transglycosylase F n=1 Tax=Desulfosarcina ovata subsp. sediminis TaxID=885957 RepID=A0A5K7ZCW0_9BACT|nr:membrane-bound lytic murein transglycosylase MltF [Desulfosarcina ovata]BBO79832.1 membrane-bound lytic murein transglycosylase F [Desulfosarcina ovata subsp. sediminis]
MHLTKRRLGKYRLIVLIWVFLIAGCDPKLLQNDLEALKARGELVLITRNNVACYYEGPHGHAGFEYDLAKSFARSLGLRLRVEILEEEAAMVAALKAGRGDIIAAGFPFGSQSARLLALGPGYLEITQQVVGRRGGVEIRGEAQLDEYTLWMTGSSARIEILENLRQRHPAIHWQILSAYNAEDLLQMVWNRALPLTLVDSNIIAMTHHDYPELKILMSLQPSRQLAWATDPRNRRLIQAIHQWFNRRDTRETINGLVEHYYRHLESFDYVDLARYRRRIKSRLPRYRAFFKTAAQKYALDWKLVAAQAYQESHWDPRATSYTGVRGIMMLTRETATAMGIEDRTDVETSILAGTRYLARLHRQVGPSVPEPDRTFMALAAYNIGFGHLNDAQTLAKRLGKPPNSWRGVRSVLPFLQQKKYYTTLEHRYARGKEAVTYVDRIRTYYKMLQPIIDSLADGQPADRDPAGFPGP